MDLALEGIDEGDPLCLWTWYCGLAPLDFSHSLSVTIPLHWGATKPKSKWQEIDWVKASDRTPTTLQIS